MTKNILFLGVFLIQSLLFAQNNSAMPQSKPFTKNELTLINEKNHLHKFRVLLTTSRDDFRILRTKSIDLDPTDSSVKKLADRMLATVLDEETRGVGIAAPQIGINRNAVWIQRFDQKDQPFQFFINPKITWYSSLLQKGREGCLSIPDTIGNVVRSYAIRIEFYDLDGQFHDEVIEGFTAVIAQHEVDHLNGVLFTDRLQEQEKTTYTKAGAEQNLLYKKASE
ncbi:peptide deformylase [Weeksella virosa]|uniref:Peptide deformylase n=1 Tax=Weeksella virosa (strain ATCC 43766 / DSM 16922 / JCM 21250 / CCUG 30538 / CDC 9751 / IAM 14551 / NBRC 16016 / NCTC 11634 / CL345/78) TaxID=865938 RepID=F0P084_WEEVC|nr:peptide deformylase [Weeksella virosa]ADX68444.1 Peptide deformylase [Weeksella virosa DSM 16922]MDK7375502.1 peptide deformylase [Weeksella virosa]MDK7674591.1 peptide deformylase [Weeksella virosa]SUP54778.1 Peptide deformylase [Weeksella virosa]VEH63899.1 Peptide deformylase [Weeksella virosa]